MEEETTSGNRIIMFITNRDHLNHLYNQILFLNSPIQKTLTFYS